MTTRWWLISVAGTLAFAGTGCGLSPAPSHQHVAITAANRGRVRIIAGVDPPLPAKPITPVARRLAAAAAIGMLASAVVPPGSRAASGLRGRYLDGPAQSIGCNPIEDGTRLWLVPGSPGSLTTFLLSHVPATMTKRAWGSSTSRGVPVSYFVVDAAAGSHPEGELVFTFAPVGSGTGLRVDALTVPSGADCLTSGGGGILLKPVSPRQRSATKVGGKTRTSTANAQTRNR